MPIIYELSIKNPWKLIFVNSRTSHSLGIFIGQKQLGKAEGWTLTTSCLDNTAQCVEDSITGDLRIVTGGNSVIMKDITVQKCS
jgi:hypothetical protein